ncbi:MAG: EAL domain-containing protein [Acidimicrobiia bacterium]|nr:EAL domain-containing protein [Acidimicrobiia bacterium]
MSPGGVTTRHRRAALAVLGLTLAAASIGAIALGAVPETGPAAPVTIPFALLVVAFFVIEVFVIDIELRREVHSISLSEVPLVLGLFFISPPLLIAARLLGSGAALVVQDRRIGLKLFVNLASFLAETVVAVVVFLALVPLGVRPGPQAWLAAVAAIVAADAIAAATVTLAVRLSEGRLPGGSLFPVIGGMVAALANTSLALVAAIVIWDNPWGSLLLVAFGGVDFLAFRGYASLRQRYQSLAALQDFTRVVGRSLEIDSVVASVVGEARDLTRCELAELVLLSASGEGIRVTDHDERGRHIAPLTALDSTDLLWANLLARGEAFIAGPVTAEGDALGGYLAARELRTVMAAPLQTDQGTRGMLMVANPLAEQATFDAEDLRLFETLANHATVSLENGRLVDELRQEAAEKEHQALHDALTGLPNRSLFLRELKAALASERDGELIAVMLMDLDHFKEVNDTLGHHEGDSVLQEIAARLQRAVRPGDVIARLGGDEFAVMLPAVRDADAALERARALHGVVSGSVTTGGLALAVGASIGVALAPEHGNDPTLLLQRADIAMYLAKGQGSGCEPYTLEADGHSRERLALAGELRDAIERGQLVLHFQPKAHVETGAVYGVEALVRWEHPERGLVYPDMFIPAAEHAGVIWELTEYVLHEAVRERELWSAHGVSLDVSVNVSARDLLDDRLLDTVAAMLRDRVLPRGALTLEITESQIMAEPARVSPMLARLNALGVRLSIDDFGTGYSSFASLRRLPIDEIKVDKSFVMGMGDDENDIVIVRSTVDLGRNLGLTVVAEGVEDAIAYQRLRSMGCDSAQGYFLSRPVTSDELLRWVLAGGFEAPDPDPAESHARRRLRVAT